MCLVSSGLDMKGFWMAGGKKGKLCTLVEKKLSSKGLFCKNSDLISKYFQGKGLNGKLWALFERDEVGGTNYVNTGKWLITEYITHPINPKPMKSSVATLISPVCGRKPHDPHHRMLFPHLLKPEHPMSLPSLKL